MENFRLKVRSGSRFGIGAPSLNDVAHSDRAYHHRHQPLVGIGVALIFAVVWPEREATPSGKKLNSSFIPSERMASWPRRK